MPKIFISYSRVDVTFALKLKDSLDEQGLDVWMDLEDIGEGEDWSDAVQDGLDTSDLMLLILSPDSMNSKNVRDEFKYFLDRKKTIIPLYWRECTPYFQLGRLNYIEFREAKLSYDQAISQLFRGLSKNNIALNKPALAAETTGGQRIQDILEAQEIRSRRGMMAIVASILAVILISGALAYVSGVFDGLGEESGDDPTEETEVANAPTETPTGSPSDTPTNTAESTATKTTTMTFTPSDTPTATDTLVPPETRAFTLAAQTIAAVTANQQATEAQYTFTPTPTYTSTSTATDTPDIAATDAGALANLYATQTAEVWTDTPIPLGFPGNPIASNDQWQPVEQGFDGVTMVLVPVGSFMMGSEDGLEDERPAHLQQFDMPFWIDKYEVTRAQYAECVAAGVCTTTPDNEDSTEDNQPISPVTWFQAYDYCAWRDVRLSNEHEWEYAARGPDNLEYPWGNEFIAENVVYSDNSDNQTAAVGSKPSGASWVGALDMSGNVWEWTGSISMDYPYILANDTGSNTYDNNARVFRGGSFGNDDSWMPSAVRTRSDPSYEFHIIGIRCARSY